MLSKCSSNAWPGLWSASRPGTARSLHWQRQAQAGPQACKEQPVPDAPAASGSAAVYQKLVEGKRFTCTQVRSTATESECLLGAGPLRACWLLRPLAVASSNQCIEQYVRAQCGACCTGSGDVWVNEADARRIASHLHIKEADFLRRYTKKYTRKSGWWLLRSTGQNQALPCSCARSLSTSTRPDASAVCGCAGLHFLGQGQHVLGAHVQAPTMHNLSLVVRCVPNVPASCLSRKGAMLCMLSQLVCHVRESS